ncbi:hypothetical protein ILUMI_11547 [Ignelater luminosus]|uniref:RNA-directed DNA polymerase n=1 Tax=Ignelater luminosus TaxID=2038154 RepID=A0A8K0D032_IGNLU|nr:hypothetical protein ILUMI_11547 [Ignelater luminosus]
MEKLLFKKPEISPVATCSSSLGLIVNSQSQVLVNEEENSENTQNNSDANSAQKYQSSFKKKRSIRNNQDQKFVSSNNKINKNKFKCRRCGTLRGLRQCPAYGQICKKCGIKNHFAISCRVKNVKTIECNSNSSSTSDLFVNTIRVNNVHHKQNHVWDEIVSIENGKLKIKVDTGADVSIMPLKVFKKLDSQFKIRPTNYVLKALQGSTLKPTGVVRLHCNYKGNEIYEDFMIIEHAEQVLLGGRASLQLQLVKRINSNIANDNVKTKIINENSDIFTGHGKFSGQCCITVLDKFEPVCHPSTKVTHNDPEMLEMVHYISRHLTMFEKRKTQFKNEIAKDKTLNKISQYYFNQWPTENKVSAECKLYYKFRDDIYIEDDIVFIGNKVIVPKTLQSFVLQLIHKGHVGIDKTISKARQLFYWPHMSKDITAFIKSCNVCEKYMTSKCKELLLPLSVPTLRFNKVGVDILQFGGYPYLAAIDHFSHWRELQKLTNKTSKNVTDAMQNIFPRFGYPETIIADNLPFVSHECKTDYCEKDISIFTCSPHHHRSNGMAEKATMKRSGKKLLSLRRLMNLDHTGYNDIRRNTKHIKLSYTKLNNNKKLNPELYPECSYFKHTNEPNQLVVQKDVSVDAEDNNRGNVLSKSPIANQQINIKSRSGRIVRPPNRLNL